MNKIQKNDIIYLGIKEHSINFDCTFRVLDPEKTNTGEKGIFLVSENLISAKKGKGIRFKKAKKPYNNLYQDSEARKWCQKFYEEHFYENEKKAIIRTNKTDEAYVKIHYWDLLHHKKQRGECPFVKAENILSGDSLFPLSSQEADNKEYGFDDELKRIAFLNGKPQGYWLRSPHSDDFPKDVGLVFHNGWLLDFLEDKNTIFHVAKICMRPALNLDLDMIEEFVPVKSHDDLGYQEWVLRYKGESNADFQKRTKQYEFNRRFIPKKPLQKQKINAFFRFFLTLFVNHVNKNREKKKEKAN